MANTHGFDAIAELSVNALRELLKAAWKSGGDNSSNGVIPEYINIPGPTIPAPVTFGPYQVASGHIQIPQDQLDLAMDTGINGVNIKLGAIINVEIANPPVDSAKFFDMTADVHVRTPIRITGDSFEIGADFTAMPADGVSVAITSGDPIGPIANSAIEEYVHKKYQDETIPHFIELPEPISFSAFTMDARIEFYDDLSNPSRKINISKPDATHVKISIPTYIRFYNITGSYMGYGLATPMAVNATTEMVAELIQTNDHIIAKTAAALISLTNFSPAAGQEGSNYSTNKTMASIAGYDLDSIITSNFSSAASNKLKAMGDISVFIPTLQQIQDFIAGKVKSELLFRKSIQVWKVYDPSGTTTVSDVTPKALSSVFAICINGGSTGDSSSVTNFLPGGRDFAIAVSGNKVQTEFNKERDNQYGTLPTTLPEKIKDKTVKLNSLGLALEEGHLDVFGGVTVVDAIADSIDVDADFSQKVNLHWEDNPNGGQMLKHTLDGDPDVSMSTWAKIIIGIIGFLTLGIVGAIIAIIIVVVVEGIASEIGGSVARSESGKVEGIGAWPEHLDNIGNVQARFENPVIIQTDGLVFSGNMIITSQNALTSIDMAKSHGPYVTSGNIPVNLNGGVDKPTSLPLWMSGDGKTFSIRSTSCRYGKSGIYVAKLQIKVNETGGATTKSFARVQVNNVSPKVNFLTSEITINEGEEIELKGSFTDDNWLDTHKAWVDFNDNSKPQDATVVESNKEPQAQGTFSVKHAWCDDGVYKVQVKVQDSAGGIGEDTMTVNVKNVAPSVYTYKTMCVILGQPVRLEAVFTDPGWCDSHVGTWNCGDGNIKMATITEKHTSPLGIGVASVSHIYTCPGTYLANVIVMDDDGGKGSAFLVVTVNDLMNAGFEKGFRYKQLKEQRFLIDSVIANEWQPFAEPILDLNENQKSAMEFNAAHYVPNEYICREGQRAQGIKLEGSGIAGIRQSLCVNTGWDYEFTAFCHLPASSSGVSMIGIDPTGGTQAASNDVIWVKSLPVNEWVHISVRVTARGRVITCFAGVQQDQGQSVIFFDKMKLFMIQPCDPISLIMKKDPDEKPNQIKDNNLEFTHLSDLEKYMSSSTTETIPSFGTYQQSVFGVRFVDVENPPPRFTFNKQTSEKMAQILINGVVNMTTNLVKSLVDNAIGKVIPFLSSENKEKKNSF